MSNEGSRPERFDVRGVNLIKITKLVDIDIVIAEADFCLTDIDRQIKDKFGDHRWQADATRAKGEIEHKRKLAILKRAALVEAATPPEEVSENNFRGRFYRKAEELLQPAMFLAVCEAAKYRAEAA